MSNLLKQRGEVFNGMKYIMDIAPEKRSDSDYAKYNELEASYQDLTKKLEVEARFATINGKINEAIDTRAISGGKNSSEDEVRSAFFKYLRTGDVSELRASDNQNKFSSAEGGVNVPTILYNTLQRTIAELSVIRQAGVKVLQTTSTTTLPIVGTGVTAQFTAEYTSGSYTPSVAQFASVTLGAYKATALCKVSEELLQDASTDLEATLAAEIGTAFANLDERALISGSASGPTGLVQYTGTVGGSTVLSQNLGSSTGSLLLDNMIAAYYKMQGARRQNSVWIVGDALASQMRQLKASTAGTYLWQTSLTAGQPDLFLGRPVYNTAFLPSTWPSTTGVAGCLLYPEHFVIGDRGGMSMTMLRERYADEGNVAWIAHKRFDGALTSGQSLVKLVANIA